MSSSGCCKPGCSDGPNRPRTCANHKGGAGNAGATKATLSSVNNRNESSLSIGELPIENDNAYQHHLCRSRSMETLPKNLDVETLLPILASDMEEVESSHGAMEKYYCLHKNEKFMIKVETVSRFYDPEKELLANQIFKEMGLPVADFCMVVVSNKKNNRDEIGFAQKIFLPNDTSCEDFSRMSSLKSYIQDESQYSLDSILEVIQRKSMAPEDDSRLFVRMVIADSIIGNEDRHWKNIAFVKTGDRYRLSPVYDNYCFAANCRYSPAHELEGTILVPGGERKIVDTAQRLSMLGHGDDVYNFAEGINFDKIREIIQKSNLTEEEILFTNEYIQNQLKKIRGTYE